ncbi:hypothetical protein DFH09DRAFT_1179622 [Mycena vulgaris]|nr:hypothetical protein DFH09DRAFT_1179622 [Mycena vulgaris]
MCFKDVDAEREMHGVRSGRYAHVKHRGCERGVRSRGNEDSAGDEGAVRAAGVALTVAPGRPRLLAVGARREGHAQGMRRARAVRVGGGAPLRFGHRFSAVGMRSQDMGRSERACVRARRGMGVQPDGGGRRTRAGVAASLSCCMMGATRAGEGGRAAHSGSERP